MTRLLCVQLCERCETRVQGFSRPLARHKYNLIPPRRGQSHETTKERTKR